jgi:hypothetical protein
MLAQPHADEKDSKTCMWDALLYHEVFYSSWGLPCGQILNKEDILQELSMRLRGDRRGEKLSPAYSFCNPDFEMQTYA